MLRFVIITTGTGTLLFEKVWQYNPHTDGKGNMIASLLTAMEEYSKQSTGLFVTYMEFGSGAITLVSDEATMLRCILFHDKEEGAEFGRLIANQILRTFIESFPEADFTHIRDISQFSSFNNKLVEAISQSARSILLQLKTSRAISNALLISDDGNTHSTGSGLDDQLGIVANLQAMLAFANDIMLSKEDRPRLITLDMMRQTVLVHRIGQSSLVCVCKKNRDPATYRDKIATAVLLLEKLFLLQGDYGR